MALLAMIVASPAQAAEIPRYVAGGGWKARGYKLDRSTRPARLSIISSGAECELPAGQECTITLRWDGAELQRVRQ